MVLVSNAQRVVFPEAGVTKGDVVAYYERIAGRTLPHVVGRPLSLRRFPKGVGAPGFFQKNVPPHYPASIERHAVPRSHNATRAHAASRRKGTSNAGGEDTTIYPLLSELEQLPYLANQGAIEFHVPTARASSLSYPDRVVIDLDPPSGAFTRVRRAAYLVRDSLAAFGLATVPVATGSKGYHLVCAIAPTVRADELALALQQFGALAASAHPDELTIAFRVAARGQRVFIDWLRNFPLATVIAPFSLRATTRATVAVPLRWDEVETTDPDAFTIADVERLLDRPDPLLELGETAQDAAPFAAAVGTTFAASGLVLEPFDRFRS
jgi:bifunctional non-homologous end joining protein LigD